MTVLENRITSQWISRVPPGGLKLVQSLCVNAVLGWGLLAPIPHYLVKFALASAGVHDNQSIKAHGAVQAHGLSPSSESLGNPIIQWLLILYTPSFLQRLSRSYGTRASIPTSESLDMNLFPLRAIYQAMFGAWQGNGVQHRNRSVIQNDPWPKEAV